MLEIGKIVNTHGLRGELKVLFSCDESLFEQLKTLYIAGQPMRLLSHRFHKGHLLATLEGITTVEQAMALKNRRVEADRAQISLPEGHFFYSDIYGFAVYDRRVDRVVGTLLEVRENPGSMLYVVADGEETFYIPAVDAFKRGVDFQGKTVYVETIEGMLPHEN